MQRLLICRPLGGAVSVGGHIEVLLAGGRIGINGLKAILEPFAELGRVEEREAGVHYLEKDLNKVECKAVGTVSVPRSRLVSDTD